MRIIVGIWAFLCLHGCAYLPPVARPIAPLASEAEQEQMWRELGGLGAHPVTVFVKPDCENGLQDQNGSGCVRGQHYAGVAYVAALPTWAQTLAHEYLHAIIGDAGHQSSRWERCGDYWCVAPTAYAHSTTPRAFESPIASPVSDWSATSKRYAKAWNAVSDGSDAIAGREGRNANSRLLRREK